MLSIRQSLVCPQEYLGGLRYFIGPRIGMSNWIRLRTRHEVTSFIGGHTKDLKHSPTQALPLPVHKIERVIAYLLHAHARKEATYDDYLWVAMFVVGFFGCARLGELAGAHDKDKLLRFAGATVTDKGFTAFLPYHKVDRLWKGLYYKFIGEDCGHDGLDAIKLYLRARKTAARRWQGQAKPLFVFENGQVVSKLWFVNRLKDWAGDAYQGHSLRLGGATYYLNKGYSTTRIMALGRWSSAAWADYVRNHPNVELALLRREHEALAPAPVELAIEG